VFRGDRMGAFQIHPERPPEIRLEEIRESLRRLSTSVEYGIKPL